MIREILARHGVCLRKNLGQHFLADANVLSRIVEAIGPSREEAAIEVGAGIGTLTVALAPLVRRLVAVEVDPRLVPILMENVQEFSNVEVVAGDFRPLPLGRFGEDLLLVGNLPYMITSAVLLKLVEERAAVGQAVFTVQWEVGEKLVAPPGPKVSRLGIHLRAYFDVELLRKISRTVFFPPPEVDGALVRLTRLPVARITVSEEAFARTLAMVFGHRRKTLRQALAAHLPVEVVDRVIAELGLSPRSRGEALDLSQLNRLAQILDRLFTNRLPMSPR